MVRIYCAMRTAWIAGVVVWAALADPVPVRHVQGSIHGFVVLKDLDDRLLASGDVTQIPSSGRVTSTLSLHFRDGSLYEEVAVFSQRRTFRLLSYKQIEKGPSFKIPLTLTFDSSGKATVDYIDKDGKEKTESEQLTLPLDIANGIVPLLLTNTDSKADTTLSMVVATPKPRLVKLKISPSADDSFSIGGVGAKAVHFVVNIDIGGITGVAAKVAGKQPPPTHVWIAAGGTPVFLKSEGALFDEGPIWRIELASPTWPKAATK